MDSCKRRERKELLSSRSIASKVPGACPSEAQAQGSLSETHSWTVTQSGSKGGVKREATITAGVLRPRYLKTYARPAPVNRAKRARPRLDRGQRFDEERGEHDCGQSERCRQRGDVEVGLGEIMLRPRLEVVAPTQRWSIQLRIMSMPKLWPEACSC